MLGFVIFGIGLLVWMVFAEKLRSRAITGQMFFVIAGFVVNLLGWGEVDFADPALRLLGELALVFLLFSHALLLDFRALRHQAQLPARLLVIGLPLTVLLGTAVSLFLFPGFTIWEAALLGSALAITDNSILGQTTIYDKRIPARIRQALIVESGLGHGLVLVIFLILLVVLQVGVQNLPLREVVLLMIKLVGWSFVIGVVFGYLGGQIVEIMGKVWPKTSWQRWIAVIIIGGLTYAAGSFLDGNGFLAVFIAGLVIGSGYLSFEDDTTDFVGFISSFLSYGLFFVMGMWVLPAFSSLTWELVLFALLSVTLIRGLPVFLSLSGAKLSNQTKLFVGWLGPKGLAAVILGVIFIQETSFVNAKQMIAFGVIVTVLLSVFVHGASAVRLVARYGRFAQQLPEDAAEKQAVTELHSYRIPLH